MRKACSDPGCWNAITLVIRQPEEKPQEFCTRCAAVQTVLLAAKNINHTIEAINSEF